MVQLLLLFEPVVVVEPVEMQAECLLVLPVLVSLAAMA